MGEIEATHATLLLKRSPDRPLCAEKRAIAYLGRIAIYFDDAENYQDSLPAIQEMARRIFL